MSSLTSSKPIHVKIGIVFFAIGLILLTAQYVTGMDVSIYAKPPFESGNLSLHYVIGTATALWGLLILVAASLSRRIGPASLATVGFVSILIAGQSGREFAFYTNYSGFYSLLMALFWVAAFAAYLLGLFIYLAGGKSVG